jgi:hypothetical protein
LQERLGSLTLPLPHGKATSALVRQIDGRSYVFPANEQRLEELTMQSGPGAETVMLSMRVDGKDRRLRVQHGRWEKGQFPYGAQGDRPVGVGGAWESDEVYVLKLCYYETPFTLTMRLRFAGDQVVCDAETNVAFGPTKRPQLVGKRR